jgi:hypothetical protein
MFRNPTDGFSKQRSIAAMTPHPRLAPHIALTIAGAAALATLLTGGRAHAADVHPFSTPRTPDISVVPGTAVISDPAYGGRSVLRPITLTVKTDARRQADAVRQVRLFRMGDGALPPTYNDALDDARGKFGDCDVYMTVVLPVRHATVLGQAHLQIDPLSRSFLEVGRGTMRSARWMMVFETSTSEPHAVFRLQQSSKPTYFAGGWIFTLTAEQSSYSAAEVVAAAKAQILPQDLQQELNRADRSRPCHVATLTSASDGGVQLHACVVDPDFAGLP